MFSIDQSVKTTDVLSIKQAYSAMSHYDYWHQPRCLVDDGGDGTIGLNMATAEALSRVTDPLDVVCILGGYRTGKSFLMNRLSAAAAAGSNTGSFVPSWL